MSAILSPDRVYRYALHRKWDANMFPTPGTVAFVMLNPSTADEREDDPTIRRCIGFARTWGYCSMTVVNLFALRSTDPAGLLDVADPVGPDNDLAIRDVAADAAHVVAAWGAMAHPLVQRRIREVVPLLGPVPLCLGTTASGQPRHPLYVKGDTNATMWRPPNG